MCVFIAVLLLMNAVVFVVAGALHLREIFNLAIKKYVCNAKIKLLLLLMNANKQLHTRTQTHRH